MILRDFDRRPFARYLMLTLIAVAIGLGHRRATADAFADDRLLGAEPSWLQMGAPLWHAAVDQSPSVAHGLIRAFDPLTGASTAGDTRALAAVAVALSAALLFFVMRRDRVPAVMATALACAVSGAVLPVALAVSATDGLQMLAAAGLLAVAGAAAPATAIQVGALVVLTVIGALNHASFLAFAAPAWGLCWRAQPADKRARVAMAGVVSLAVGLIGVAVLLRSGAAEGPPIDDAAASIAAALEAPGTGAIVVGLLTGRFTGALQPFRETGLIEAASRSMPGPLALCVPMALLACMRPATRPQALAYAVPALALGLFAVGTWLPDPAVTLAPARVALLALSGLGLWQMATLPVRGATAVAVVASVMIGCHGWLAPSRWIIPTQTIRLQTFVEAAAPAVGQNLWTGERLAVIRGLLMSSPALETLRLPARSELLRLIPEEQRVLVLGDGQARLSRRDVWVSPIDVGYRSAESFFGSLADWTWLAVAVHDGAPDGFCRDLLTRLGADTTLASSSHVSALAHVGRSPHGPMSLVIASDRLDVEYGRAVGTGSRRSPAQFLIETDPGARILVNRTPGGPPTSGMAVAVFDPWTSETNAWQTSSCRESPGLPIRDSQLRAGYFVGFAAGERPDVPVIAATRVPVRLGYDGLGWFGDGWHGPEGGDAAAFRWTRALEAHVRAVVGHRQALQVRLAGDLAATADFPNALGLSWNGAIIRPLSPWTNGSEGEWTIPAPLVRRGLNTLTIQVARLVAPSAPGAAEDPRALGARITRLSFAPVGE